MRHSRGTLDDRRPTTTDDQEILKAVCAGDPAALEALMSQYSGRVYRLAYGITRNSADAEEVVQDVFLTVLRKGATFEGRSALGSWIYRIAANAALNKRRGKRGELQTSLEELLPTYKPDGHRDGDRAWVLADWSQNPEDDVLSHESRSTLSRALDRLPEHYRAVVVLRDVEGLSNEEAAAVLGESVASVKSRLHRSRMVLREQLTHYYVEARA